MLGLFVLDIALYSYHSFSTCGGKSCSIKETKGKAKPEFMPGENNEEFLQRLQQTHLSTAEYAELGLCFQLSESVSQL